MSDDQISTILLAIQALDDKLVSQVTGLRQEMTTMRADIMDRIDRLQDRLVSQQDDGTVCLGTAEKALLIATNTREEGRATQMQITALLRSMRQVNGRLDRLEDRGAAGG